jgi:hypothetical protein
VPIIAGFLTTNAIYSGPRPLGTTPTAPSVGTSPVCASWLWRPGRRFVAFSTDAGVFLRRPCRSRQWQCVRRYVAA